MSQTPYNPKKLLRCPNGCGWPINFCFGLYPCADCGRLLCEHCQKIWRGSRYCKACLKKRLDALARERYPRSSTASDRLEGASVGPLEE